MVIPFSIDGIATTILQRSRDRGAVQDKRAPDSARNKNGENSKPRTGSSTRSCADHRRHRGKATRRIDSGTAENELPVEFLETNRLEGGLARLMD
jgi:hypothetical protein